MPNPHSQRWGPGAPSLQEPVECELTGQWQAASAAGQQLSRTAQDRGTVGLQQRGAQPPPPRSLTSLLGGQLQFGNCSRTFFSFGEESCKSLRAAPGLWVTISCLEERIVSPLEHEAGGRREPGLLASAGNWHLSTFCAQKGHSCSPGPPRAPGVKSARLPGS